MLSLSCCMAILYKIEIESINIVWTSPSTVRSSLGGHITRQISVVYKHLGLFVTLCVIIVFLIYWKHFLNEVVKTPLLLHQHFSESTLILWMAVWESSLSVQTKWLIAPFCNDTAIIIIPAVMESIETPSLSWFCGFVLWRSCQLFLVHLQYLLITGVTCWAITPCSEENRVALKQNGSCLFFFILSKRSSELSGN